MAVAIMADRESTCDGANTGSLTTDDLFRLHATLSEGGINHRPDIKYSSFTVSKVTYKTQRIMSTVTRDLKTVHHNARSGFLGHAE